MIEKSKTAANLELLQDITRERNEHAQRLARFEFQAMKAELADGTAFTVANASASGAAPDSFSFAVDVLGLPQLNVPLSRIAWHAEPNSLPVIAILIEIRSPETVISLIALLHELHATPFARIVFITRHLDMVPFFDRYGFAVVCVGASHTNIAGPILLQRFGVRQIRNAKDGKTVWFDKTLPRTQLP
jgi:hypothetical protein